MKKKELLRIARICIPVLNPQGNDGDDLYLLADDLQVENVCRLWAGMGHIYRLSVNDSTFIVKYVRPPSIKNQSFGDRRKAKSYQVEANFYEHVAQHLINQGVRVPKPLTVEKGAKERVVIAMTHHGNVGETTSDDDGVRAVLQWLAKFHAAHWGASQAEQVVREAGLQETGSYWYLDTRPDEHADMPNHGWQGRLKMAARAIDAKLKRDPLQCIIHGDAKDANILYEKDDVLFCDFQYCGMGPPTRDLAYFFCSSVSPENEQAMLQYYLTELRERLSVEIECPTFDQLTESMTFAYCDFYRFMSGWGFCGSGAEGRVVALLDRLDGGTKLSEEDYDSAIRREFS
jgi:thiamine kinase-like enzyme